jgi:quercetin dioxygenase-like cupin family protein
MARTGALAAVLALALLGTGCAVPGQLGAEQDADPPAAAPAVPGVPQVLGVGLIDYPVGVSTPGPAVFSVRELVIPPGATTGWHAHPGTETSVVTSGTLTVQIEDGCEPVRFDAGEALFVADAVPHVQRNEGSAPVEMVVTYLLAPGAPDRVDAPPSCPA